MISTPILVEVYENVNDFTPTCWGLSKIVISVNLASFFQLARLGSFNRGNWFGPPNPTLPFWAHKIKKWFLMDLYRSPKSTRTSPFFHLFFFFLAKSNFPNCQSKIMIYEYLISPWMRCGTESLIWCRFNTFNFFFSLIKDQIRVVYFCLSCP